MIDGVDPGSSEGDKAVVAVTIRCEDCKKVLLVRDMKMFASMAEVRRTKFHVTHNHLQRKECAS